MTSKEKKVSDNFCGDYKALPLKARVEVIKTAKNILEIQKGNKVFFGSVINPSLYEDGENGGQIKL